jgi:hypothetical protein
VSAGSKIKILTTATLKNAAGATTTSEIKTYND